MVSDLDLIEINEAFAIVAIQPMRELRVCRRIQVSTGNLRAPASLHTIHTSSALDLRTPGHAHDRADLPNAAGLQLTLDLTISVSVKGVE
jgi:hypothetical protein